MIKHLENRADFESLTKSKILVDFYADWCGPCQMLGSILESVENDLEIDILKINTDEFNELALSFGVMSIPALFLMDKGKVISKHVGMLSKEELLKFIKENG